MSRTRRRRPGWLSAVAALLVVLGVAAMHADLGVLADASGSHEVVAVASHSDDLAAPMSGPADPAAPADPCHAANQVCCVSALPTSAAPRQWIALLLIGITVLLGTNQVPGLKRFSTLRPGIGWRPPPDLAALCVLRT